MLGALVDRVKNYHLGPNGKPTEVRWLAAVDCFAEVAEELAGAGDCGGRSALLRRAPCLGAGEGAGGVQQHRAASPQEHHGSGVGDRTMNQKLAEARILAARKMPYMTHQVMSLIPVERPGLGTMAVDEYCRLYFDPAFLESRDLKHLAFVVLHEAIHVWGRHCQAVRRSAGRETRQGSAGDMAAGRRCRGQ